MVFVILSNQILKNRTKAMAAQQEQIKRAIKIAEAFGATRLILFGRAATEPDQAKDMDLACDSVPGWKIFELGARLEEELKIPLDLIPLSPPNRFTRTIEHRGTVLL
jgi:predicted nucleotidyltransferase